MQQKEEMLQEIGDFKDKCITTVSVEISETSISPTISNPSETEYGYHFKVSVSKQNITHDAKYCLKKIADKLSGKIPNHSSLKKKLEILVGKVTVFQSLENETNLVHHKIDHQEWGQTGVMLWSPAQKQCITMGRSAFRGEDEPLRLIIRGPQGSGKTLVSMRLAKEFVQGQEEGNVILHVDPSYSLLQKDLRDSVKKDKSMRGRVVIGTLLIMSDGVVYRVKGSDEEKR
jgi:hypothetical protein